MKKKKDKKKNINDKLDFINDIYVKIKKDYPILAFFVLSNFINAMILRLSTTGSFKFRATVIDFGFVMLIGVLSLFFKEKGRKRYYIIMSIVLVIICLVNSIYYNYYDSFVSV